MPELANTAGFMLYPRGFLGAIAQPAIKRQPQPFSSSVSRVQPNLNLVLGGAKAQHLEVNQRVEELYAKMINQHDTFADFEFRERVLQCAITAFGTDKFDLWYLMQSKSPAAGELHRAFLKDTLRFISTGEREQHLETWNVVISHADRGELKSTIDEYAQTFFGISSPSVTRYPQNSDLLDVIATWTSRPGGFQDLLFTLHILFGVQ